MLSWLGRERHLLPRQRRFIAVLAAWDGGYEAASRGALAFELLYHHLARRLVGHRRRVAYSAAWGARALIWQDIMAADPGSRQRALRGALGAAARALGTRQGWGDRHRLRLGHALALAPVLGRAWRFTDLPATGTTDTLQKTAHPLTERVHGSRYGSGARHISDLSDLDRNHFVLLGGQDGWLGSTTFLDQVPVWRRGESITVPLRPETARATFPYCTELTP
jgi:penicillin amidase